MDHNLNVKPNTTKLLEETWENVLVVLGQAEFSYYTTKYKIGVHQNKKNFIERFC